MYIYEAVIKVMQAKKASMTVPEIYENILRDRLYSFHAKKVDPQAVVALEIWKRCEGVDRKSTLSRKYFKKVDPERYYLLEEPV